MKLTTKQLRDIISETLTEQSTDLTQASPRWSTAHVAGGSRLGDRLAIDAAEFRRGNLNSEQPDVYGNVRVNDYGEECDWWQAADIRDLDYDGKFSTGEVELTNKPCGQCKRCVEYEKWDNEQPENDPSHPMHGTWTGTNEARLPRDPREDLYTSAGKRDANLHKGQVKAQKKTANKNVWRDVRVLEGFIKRELYNFMTQPVIVGNQEYREYLRELCEKCLKLIDKL